MFVNRRVFSFVSLALPVIIFLFPIPLSANFVSDIVINEIAWMGTSTQYDEWIELYNASNDKINLNDWKILTPTQDNANLVLFTIDDKCASSILDSGGFFLIKRITPNDTSDTVSDKKADCIGSFGGSGLSNTGERLELYDGPSGNLIDFIALNQDKSWPAGDSTTKQTMERKNSSVAGDDASNWQSSQNPGGTPKGINSQGAPGENEEQQIADEEPISSTSAPASSNPSNHPPKAEAGPDIIALIDQEINFDASKSGDQDNDQLTFTWNFGDGQTSNQAKIIHKYPFAGKYIVNLIVSDGKTSSLDSSIVTIYSNSVIISEFMPNPEGKDSESEWIELYNNSNQAADLSSWQLDTGEKSKAFVFPANTSIAANQYLTLIRSTTKLSLNNTAGKIRLLYPTGQISQEIKYDKAPQGQSVSLLSGNEYVWTTIPTPGLSNIISNSINKTSSSLNSLAVEASEYYNPVSTIIPTNPESIPSQLQFPPINTIPANPPIANAEIVDNMGTNQINFKNPPLPENKENPQTQTASLINTFSSPSFLTIIIIIFGIAAGLGLAAIRKRMKRF
jgi:hypothetical protein